MNITDHQKSTCEKYRADYLEAPDYLKVGISENVREGIFPINGLRYKPVNGTTGWYIWAGEYSDDSEFFKPLHVEHLLDWSSLISKYLGLGPGWRFLIAPDYEDVWYDENLLK